MVTGSPHFLFLPPSSSATNRRVVSTADSAGCGQELNHTSPLQAVCVCVCVSTKRQRLCHMAAQRRNQCVMREMDGSNADRTDAFLGGGRTWCIELTVTAPFSRHVLSPCGSSFFSCSLFFSFRMLRIRMLESFFAAHLQHILFSSRKQKKNVPWSTQRKKGMNKKRKGDACTNTSSTKRITSGLTIEKKTSPKKEKKTESNDSTESTHTDRIMHRHLGFASMRTRSAPSR